METQATLKEVHKDVHFLNTRLFQNTNKSRERTEVVVKTWCKLKEYQAWAREITYIYAHYIVPSTYKSYIAVGTYVFNE